MKNDSENRSGRRKIRNSQKWPRHLITVDNFISSDISREEGGRRLVWVSNFDGEANWSNDLFKSYWWVNKKKRRRRRSKLGVKKKIENFFFFLLLRSQIIDYGGWRKVHWNWIKFKSDVPH